MRLPKFQLKLPWHRNSGQTAGLPPEVQQYYAQTKKQRKSVAWLLAFVSLIATVVLALAVFFVGRWVYHKIAGSGDKPTVVVTTPGTHEGKPSKPNKPTAKHKSSKKKTSKSQLSTGKLTNTGPGDTIAIFVLATVLGTGLYEYKLRRKLS